MRLFICLLIMALYSASAEAMSLSCNYNGRSIQYDFSGGETVTVREFWKGKTYEPSEWTVNTYDDLTQFVVAYNDARSTTPGLGMLTVVRIDFGKAQAKEWRFVGQDIPPGNAVYDDCRRLD